jgi:hypothetical protein
MSVLLLSNIYTHSQIMNLRMKEGDVGERVRSVRRKLAICRGSFSRSRSHFLPRRQLH